MPSLCFLSKNKKKKSLYYNFYQRKHLVFESMTLPSQILIFGRRDWMIKMWNVIYRARYITKGNPDVILRAHYITK